MKSFTLVLLVVLACARAEAQVVDSGSTGADGPFIAIDPLSFRVPAGTIENCARSGGQVSLPILPCTLTVPLREPPNHIFNFTTVTIGPQVTVKFSPNKANTPVFMLANGDVSIDGLISVDGEPGGVGSPVAARGGPGGYAGGVTPRVPDPKFAGLNGGPGLGPQGQFNGKPTPAALPGCFDGCYGNPELQPLVGGSGGGAVRDNGGQGQNGGGGGGAILIASSGIIHLGNGVDTAISARGGPVELISNYFGGSGSGGAIRLVANGLRGNRALDASGRFAPTAIVKDGGRIRLECPVVANLYTGTPNPPASFNGPGEPFVIFPPIMPTLRIVSVAGIPMPAQPTGLVETPDFAIPSTVANPVSVYVEATNVPNGTPVRVFAHPQIPGGLVTDPAPTPLTGPVPCILAPGKQCMAATVSMFIQPLGVGVFSAIIDSVTPVP